MTVVSRRHRGRRNVRDHAQCVSFGVGKRVARRKKLRSLETEERRAVLSLPKQ